MIDMLSNNATRILKLVESNGNTISRHSSPHDRGRSRTIAARSPDCLGYTDHPLNGLIGSVQIISVGASWRRQLGQPQYLLAVAELERMRPAQVYGGRSRQLS